MDHTTFDNLARIFATTRSRRQVLKGLFAGATGGAALAAGFTRNLDSVAAQECTPNDESCSSDDECCSGSCDSAGYCYTPDTTCIEDGGLCQAGLYCCSGLDCAPGGHCPVPAATVLPDTGAGTGSDHDSTSNLIVPIATLGAAAVVTARRLRSSPEDEVSA